MADVITLALGLGSERIKAPDSVLTRTKNGVGVIDGTSVGVKVVVGSGVSVGVGVGVIGVDVLVGGTVKLGVRVGVMIFNGTDCQFCMVMKPLAATRPMITSINSKLLSPFQKR